MPKDKFNHCEIEKKLLIYKLHILIKTVLHLEISVANQTLKIYRIIGHFHFVCNWILELIFQEYWEDKNFHKL